MAASCLSVLKHSLFTKAFVSHRLLVQSGASVTYFLQRHYSNAINRDNSSNDNSQCTHHEYHPTHFMYDNNINELTIVGDEFIERGIGRTFDEQNNKYALSPDQPLNSKILKFSIIGIPNSGKSTLTNQLMQWKVSPVSSKVHTTRKNTIASMTDKDTQIVFVDTPGVVTSQSRSKHQLETEMVSAPADSLNITDMFGVLVDASNHWTNKELGQNILQLLHLNSHLPSILILNKVDLIKDKESLLEITRCVTENHIAGQKTMVLTQKNEKTIRNTLFQKHNLQVPSVAVEPSEFRTIPTMSDCPPPPLQQSEKKMKETMTKSKDEENDVETWQAYHARMQALRHSLKGKKGWPKFQRVFMISALNGDGVPELRDYLLSQAQPGNWEFHSSFVTDQDPLILAQDLLWEKFLEVLPEEVPYKIRIETEMWEVSHDDLLTVVLNVICKKKKHLHMIIGSKGSNIRSTCDVARQAMMDAFRIDVHLKVHVKLENDSR